MVSGNVIGAYVNTTDSPILINAQNNEVNFEGAIREGGDEEKYNALGGYGAVINGTGDVAISGNVKNNKVIYKINKNTQELGGGVLSANGRNLTFYVEENTPANATILEMPALPILQTAMLCLPLRAAARFCKSGIKLIS